MNNNISSLRHFIFIWRLFVPSFRPIVVKKHTQTERERESFELFYFVLLLKLLSVN